MNVEAAFQMGRARIALIEADDTILAISGAIQKRIVSYCILGLLSILCCSCEQEMRLIAKPAALESPPQQLRFQELTGEVRSVWSANDRKVWLVGEDGAINYSVDGGNSWVEQESGTDEALSFVYGSTDTGDLWAISSSGHVLHSKNQGNVWTTESKGTLATKETRHSYLVCKPSSIGRFWGLEGNGTFSSWIEKAREWTKVGQVPLRSSQRLNFCQVDGHDAWILGGGGTILHSADEGRHWNLKASGTDANLTSMSSAGANSWIVGSGGTILHSTNSGETWTRHHSDVNSDFNAVIALDRQNVVVAGDDGILLSSTDVGINWQSQRRAPGVAITDLFANSDHHIIWATGGRGTVLYSLDRGTHWAFARGLDWNELAQTHNNVDKWHDPFVNNWWKICGGSDGHSLWALGSDGSVLQSIDGGNRWKRLLNAYVGGQAGSPPSKFDVKDGSEIWVAGGKGVIWHSADRGEHWHSQDAKISARLTYVAGDADGSHVWIAGSDGTILATTDRGLHWSPELSNTKELLLVIWVGRDGELWIAGDKGTLLHSTDWGASWITQKSDTSQVLSVLIEGDSRNDLLSFTENGDRLHIIDARGTWSTSHQPRPSSLWAFAASPHLSQIWAFGEVHEDSEPGVDRRNGQSQSPRRPGLATATDTPPPVLFEESKALEEESKALEFGEVQEDSEPRADRRNGQSQSPRRPGLATAKDTSRPPLLLEESKALDLELGSVWTILPAVNGGIRLVQTLDQGVTWSVVEDGQVGTSIFPDKATGRLWITSFSGAANTFRYGRAVGSYPSIATALVRSNVTDSTIEVTVPKAAKQVEFNLRVVGASPDIFKGGTEFEIPNMHPVERSPEVWTATFDPERLMSVSRGRKMHLVGLLESSDGTRQRVELGDFTYGPWRPGPVFISAMIVLSIPVTLTALTFVAPLVILSMYKSARIYQVVDQLPVGPWVAVARLFLKGTLLPIFLDNTRTLDAWVEKNREVIGRQFEAESRRRKISTYIELPIVSGSGERYDRPTPAKLAVFFSSKRTIIEISGPGGAGKTSLAFALARWALASEPALSKHRMLPIVVDEETEDLLAVIRRKLTGWLNEEIESDLMNALLRRRRLLIIFERLSEHSSATQQHIGKVNGRYPFLNAMIITTRKAFELEAGGEIQLFPQPLDSSNLLHFISGVLSKRIDSGERSQKELSSMKRQLQLASRLGELLGIDEKQVDLRDNIPVTPLFVRMYVEEAISSFESGLDLENLPTSIPEVYLQNLELLNPVDAYSNRLAHVEMHRVAEALGRLALGSTFIPGEFDRAQADNLMKELGWTDLATLDPVQRLIDNGVLTFQTIAGTERARFVLDPMAEFLAALAWAKSCSESPTKWGDFAQMLDQADRPENFVRALSAVWLTYHSSLHWADFKIS